MQGLMQGLLGGMLEPNPDNGLLNLSLNLAQQGGKGAPLMGGFASAIQNTQQQTAAYREYQRKMLMQKLRDGAIEQITDPDLKLLATLDPDGSTVATVLAAKLRGSRAYGGNEQPMSVKEWEYYKALPTDDDRRDYLTMKRQSKVVDFGDMIGSPDPLNTGMVLPLGDKGLPPEKVPDYLAEAATAETIAKDRAAAAVETEQKVPAYNAFQLATRPTMDAASRIWSGGIMGVKGVISGAINNEDTQMFKSGIQQMSSQLRSVFRIPGEGTLSNQEQEQYGLTLPSLKNSPGVNAKIIENLDAQMAARLKMNGGGTSARTVVRSGTIKSGPNAGKRVVEYSDGTREIQ